MQRPVLLSPRALVARTGAKRALQQVRAMPAWGQVVLENRRRGPLVVFLPSHGRRQSALLRIYNLARALRPLGWRSVVLPPNLTLAQRHAMLSGLDPDAVVMQGARHPLNRPGYFPQWPILYDLDDADFHIDHLAAPVTEAMSGVAAVLAGSDYIAQWCLAAGAPAAPVVWTGTPVSTRARPVQAGRPPVVAWAQTRPETYQREAKLVQSVMGRLVRRRPDVRLRLYDRPGAGDGGLLAGFEAAGVAVEWRPRLSYGAYLASFDDVAVSLAPLCPETPFSRGKSFGKVLAALDRKVPVVGSAACEHEAFFTPDTGAIGNSPAFWEASIDRLLARPDHRQAMVDQAFAAFKACLTTEAAAARVDGVLRDVLASRTQIRAA